MTDVTEAMIEAGEEALAQCEVASYVPAGGTLAAIYLAMEAARIPAPAPDVVEALADLDMAHDLICEAKGADGPNGGFVTDHLDAADHWIGKVRNYLEATRTPHPSALDEVDAVIRDLLVIEQDLAVERNRHAMPLNRARAVLNAPRRQA